MSDPFFGQIKMVGYNFAPVNWSFCDGQQLNISSNQALYSLLGSLYGGNDRTTFNLPDFRGRTALNYGTSTTFSSVYTIGQKAGNTAHTLTAAEMPAHTHDVYASDSSGDYFAPANSNQNIRAQFAVATNGNYYHNPSNLTSLASNTVTTQGAGQSYSLVQPSTVLAFIIAMTGQYPARN